MQLGRGISLSTLRAELHQKYGDIIRISPNELHFSKPTAFNEIYSPQNKWDKDYGFYRAFDADEALFTQREYVKAKHRRGLISNMFSKKAISEIEDLVRAQVDRFCDALKEQNAAGKSSNLNFGFQCFGADTITNFLFATCFDQLASPDFQGDIVRGVDLLTPTITVAKFSVVVVWFMHYFPASVLMRVAPSLKGLVILRNALITQVKSVMKDPKLLDEAPHRVIYNELLNPEAFKKLPLPTVSQLSDDAYSLFSAGSHSTGTSLNAGVYHLLHNPEIKQKLIDELRTVWPVLDQPPTHKQLEKLPFLTAVIKETLRIATAVPAGLPRVVPPSGAVISGASIPGGTVVSQSPLFVSFSEEVFARPREFLPERWLQPDSKNLENWLVVFSKGPRACLGINLAYCQLYLMMAYFFRRFEVREDTDKIADLNSWSEHFVTHVEGQHFHAYCVPRSD